MRFAVKAPIGEYDSTATPLRPSPIVIAGCAIVAQWGLIPRDSVSREPSRAGGRRASAFNARHERLTVAATYRHAWLPGQRCIIPAESFDLPYWGTGEEVWWRFWRADGEPWALAGIWSVWTDPVSGESVTSYALITHNCDEHPLLGRMHKPDYNMPAEMQDKRAVIPLESRDWDRWLYGTLERAQALIQLPEVDLFRHSAADSTKQVPL